MLIKERAPGDLQKLRRLAAKEKDAEQKDRWLVALHAASGVETSQIQRMLLRSRGFVQRWAYAYRDGGTEALREKPSRNLKRRHGRAMRRADKADLRE